MEIKTLILGLLVVAFSPSYSEAADWSYSGDTGPEFWATLPGNEACGGESQSPIDIDTDIAVKQEFDPWIAEGYENEEADGPRLTSLFNNGHGFTVNVAGDYLVRGGGLPTTYKALQFHLHWGSDLNRGSEHTKNGIAFPAEMHIVHYDLQYDEFPPTALSAPKGLAVIGFFIEVGEHNTAWDPIINGLKEIKYYQTEYELQEPVKLSSLIPYDDLSMFHRYDGSLTTPGCYESVIWSVFDATIKMSEDQIAEMRLLSERKSANDTEHDEFIVDNWRPTQPLNTRTLYAGFAEMGAGGPAAGSCVDRCGEFDEAGLQCQCNSVCGEYGDCCRDYREKCFVKVCSYVPTFKNKMRKIVVDAPGTDAPGTDAPGTDASGTDAPGTVSPSS